MTLDTPDRLGGLKFIGNLFLYPTIQLQDSIKILSQNTTLWINTGDVWKDLVNNFITYDTLIMSLFTITFIFSIIFWVLHKMIQNAFISFIVTIIIFIVIEMLTASVLKGVSPWTPFYAINDFIKFMWHDFNLIYDKIKGSSLVENNLNKTCAINQTC